MISGMMRTVRLFALAAFIIMAPAALFSFDLESLSTMDDDAFPLTGTVYRKDGVLPELDLLPEMPGSSALRERFEAYAPEITVQKLYRIALPAAFSAAADDPAKAAGFFTEVINAFGDPETQVGYMYHSATRDKDIILFEKSFISDDRGRRQEPFTVSASDLPFSMEYYQYVDEANFSGTVLQQQLEVTGDYLSFRSSNTERMWFTIIPILGKDGTRNEMLMTLHGSWLYVYNCTQLAEEPAVKKIGFPVHLPSLFGKRMDVMGQWLRDRVE